MAERIGNVAKRVLIADDDPPSRSLLRDILTSGGFEVVQAEDGEMALEILERGGIDLLITDRSMPRLGGIELLRQLKNEGKSLPTLVISAFGEEKLWVDAIALGAADYLLKPFTYEQVHQAVAKALLGTGPHFSK